MDSNLEKLIDETVNQLLDDAELRYAIGLDGDEGFVPLMISVGKVVSHVWQCEEREQPDLLSAAVRVAVVERAVSRLQGIDACNDLEKLIDEMVTDLTDREEFKDLSDVTRRKVAVRLRATQEKVASRISRIEKPAQHRLLSIAVCAAANSRISGRSGIDGIDPNLDEECADLGCNEEWVWRKELWRQEMFGWLDSWD